MPGGNEDVAALSALGKNSNNSPTVNVNDIQDDSLYFSPEDQAAYDQYNQQRSDPSAHGALPESTYHPGLHDNVAVGNYSGSIVGSNTLFAPGGALVPIGIMDARDAALQKAALQKQKDVDDFRKKYQKAPTSKLTNINEGLTKEYFNFHDKSWKSALKAANGDPQKAKFMLENNSQFLAKDKSYQDLAKTGDAIVGKIADIDHRIEKGDVISPAVRESMNRVKMSMNPDSDEFKNLSSHVMRLDADREFSDAANEALLRVVTSETGKAYNLSNDEDYKVFKKSVEELSPETKAAVIENLKRVYEGSSMYSHDYIERNASGLMNYKKVKEDLHISAKPKEDTSDDYTDADIAKEPSFTNVFTRNQNSSGGKPSVSEGTVQGDYGVTHKKPIPVIIPNGAHVYINDSKNGLLKSTDVNPNSKVELFKTELVKVYDGSAKDHAGTPISEQQIKDGRKWKWEPMTRGVVYEDKGGDEGKIEKEIFVPSKEIENVLVKKMGKNGEVIKGVPVDKLKTEANRRNALITSQISTSNNIKNQPQDNIKNKIMIWMKYKDIVK